MGRSLVIVGAGPMGREVYAYALDQLADGRQASFDRVAGFIDLGQKPGDHISAFNLNIDFVDALESHKPRSEFAYVTGIGNPAEKRRSVALLSGVTHWTNVIHPTAYVASSASLCAGIVMAPFSLTGIDSSLGNHVTLNVYASCGHDAHIGAFSTLCPYSAITGCVVLEEEVFLGTHVGVNPGVRIGTRCRVAAGSTVTHDVEAGSLLVGNPAKGRVMYLLDNG
ncbi:acetyltransferase [uncultured Thiodictyon sp.]|uniref:acetyltransferase n=1 Tax=uncultured Thiodictyon sp. TaxID=1846217 RepID=UPI0025F4C81A|nr:acetyltransferase [uncultured Thiodictyon sp.]